MAAVLLSHFTRRKDLLCQLDKGRGRFYNNSGRCEKEKNYFPLTGFEPCLSSR